VHVIVADNNSSDDSLEFLRTHYPDLPVIVLDKNLGICRGYNKALQQVDSEYLYA
jgi:GT2 family glycosyltransferase